MLAFGLVLIFVLWLIDKHNKWRAAAKIFFGLVGLAVLGLAGVWGWGKYESWKEEKVQALAAAQREAAVKACVERLSAKGVFDTSPCELDPSAQPQPPVTVNDWVPDAPVRPKPPRLKRVKNTSTIGVPLTTTEYGSLNCGTIEPGEIVTLLLEDNISVKVRTRAGKVGWAAAYNFGVVE